MKRYIDAFIVEKNIMVNIITIVKCCSDHTKGDETLVDEYSAVRLLMEKTK
ncbi:MAG: hypothetical protein U9R02_04660 [Thermodesulfobacteriota bacterium]|nr:hypothetical protein [Thermodesulfobacteriota bacterium]